MLLPPPPRPKSSNGLSTVLYKCNLRSSGGWCHSVNYLKIRKPTQNREKFCYVDRWEVGEVGEIGRGYPLNLLMPWKHIECQPISGTVTCESLLLVVSVILEDINDLTLLSQMNREWVHRSLASGTTSWDPRWVCITELPPQLQVSNNRASPEAL